jgi:hypothetical protein
VRKIFINITSLFLIVFMVFGISGCSPEPVTTTVVETDTTTVTSTETSTLVNTVTTVLTTTETSTYTQSINTTSQPVTTQTADSTTQSTTQTSQIDPCDNIYFTKWLGYMGYALYEEKSNLQFSYLNYNKSTVFEDSIKSIELLPVNQIITVDSFDFRDGTSSEECDIRTLDIRFNIVNTGSTEVQQLIFHMQNGKDYIWDIGSIKIEVADLPRANNMTLGVRSFVSSDFDLYYFILNNETVNNIRLTSLEYSMPKGILDYVLSYSKLQVDGSEADQSDSKNLLMENESRLFWYSIEYTQYGECDFFILKPFLKYEMNNSSYTMPLDFCIYSGYFTEDVINLIMENPYIKN